MADPCKKHLEGLVELALGNQAPDAREHVGGCISCAEALRQFGKILSSLEMGGFDAPAYLVAEAARIPIAGPAVHMRLAGSSLLTAGARLESAETFQLVFESGEHTVRLMYEKSPAGWDVLGKVEGGADWKAETGGGNVPVDDSGRFSFTAPSLSNTDVRLTGEGTSLLIPPAQEVSGGPGIPR